MSAHMPTKLHKVAPGYRTEDGRDFPAQLLHRFECSCGWKGACWYADKKRARAHFDRHFNHNDDGGVGEPHVDNEGHEVHDAGGPTEQQR